MSELKKIRANLDKGIEEIAKKLNISGGYLSQIENGKRHISSKRAIQIADLYDMPLEEIFLPTRYSVRVVYVQSKKE